MDEGVNWRVTEGRQDKVSMTFWQSLAMKVKIEKKQKTVGSKEIRIV